MKIGRYGIKGDRPDLICDTGKELFSVEAKGFSCKTVSHNEMNKHKGQAASGPIPVKFSIASVAYNMYSDIRVKYHDPINEDYEYDYELSKTLILKYYSQVLKYINYELFEIDKIKINGFEYYKLNININKIIESNMVYFNHREIAILLDKRIEEFVEGKLDNSKIFEMISYSEENIYIDTDGIGIMINF